MGELQEWLFAIYDGDKSSFEALYEDMKKPLFTVILRITRDVELSEDILQDLFLKLYLTPPKPSQNPRAYLYRMAHNLAIDSVRKERPHTNLDDTEIMLSDQIDSVSQRLDIEDAIHLLPEREIQIVTLRINGELKFREIASILDMPIGTVLWAYQKAIERLRVILGGIL